MTSTDHLVGFIIAAVLVPAIIMGGMTTAYFLSKRRVDRPRPTTDPVAESRALPAGPAEVFAPLGSSVAAGTLLLTRSSGTGGAAASSDEADLWGRDSFPASDPPQNW